jgi:glycosyltransferase involved in cell wall biosynthesis
MTATVSLIIATKDASATLHACLRSCGEQTACRQLEVIIQDACSVDGTSAIVQDVAASFPDLTIKFHQERDSGIYDAWNRGLQRAEGDWICFIGADDWWADQNAIESRIRRVSARPEVNAYIAPVLLVGRHGEARMVGGAWDVSALRRSQNIAHVGMMLKRELFSQFGDFCPGYRIAGDYEFLLRIGAAVVPIWCDQPDICVGDEGVSRANAWSCLRETHKIHRIAFGRAHAACWWAVAAFKLGMRRLLFR